MIPRSIRFTPAQADQTESGLIGFVNFVADGWQFDGVQVRRKSAGGLRLKFQSRIDNNGIERFPVSPINSHVRSECETAVFTHLRNRGLIP